MNQQWKLGDRPSNGLGAADHWIVDQQGKHVAFVNDATPASVDLMLASPDLYRACDEADTAFAVMNLGDQTPQARQALGSAWAKVNAAMSRVTGKADRFHAANPNFYDVLRDLYSALDAIVEKAGESVTASDPLWPVTGPLFDRAREVLAAARVMFPQNLQQN